MLSTYKAIVRGTTIEWGSDVSEHIRPDRPVAVYVTVLDEPVYTSPETQGQRMADVLQQLAAIHALADISDPAAWEREIRQDRQLPGREA